VASRGWHHLEPTAINERGWIVGTAQDADGDSRAFLLVPRTP
jgi:probable HAF family extracellular repeat protein